MRSRRGGAVTAVVLRRIRCKGDRASPCHPCEDADISSSSRRSVTLRQRPRLADRTDARRAAVTRTGSWQSAHAVAASRSACMSNNGWLKPMPAGVVVVDEDARLVGQPLAAPACRLAARAAAPPRCRCPDGRTSAAAAPPGAWRTTSATIPSRRSSGAYGSAARTRGGTVSQYDVVCICCSGRSSSPEPMFSFV